ncbi:hypothetical protein ACTXMP_14010 [Psychrobacter glacincola]|uniref:hypothetical protein n=2 Tax=Moraxellaceae TaxID=468 RepID=UPI0039A2AFE2
MQKQLIQQVSKAMQANADTIARQKEIIDHQEQSIERLKRLLTALAETQDKELKALPSMFDALETSLSKHTKEQQAWWSHRKQYTEGQIIIAEQLSKLATIQMQLTAALSEYQSTLVPADELTSDMSALETMLKGITEQLKSSQNAIKQSQSKLTSELETVAKLINK